MGENLIAGNGDPVQWKSLNFHFIELQSGQLVETVLLSLVAVATMVR